MSNDELNWDSELDPNAGAFTLLPECEATFAVVKMERKRKDYGKLGECHAAALTLLCQGTNGEGEGTVETLLILHKSLEWKLVQFARSIGHMPKIRWSEVETVTGRCKVGIRKFKKRGDPEDAAGWTGESNEIVKFLPADASGVGEIPF